MKEVDLNAEHERVELAEAELDKQKLRAEQAESELAEVIAEFGRYKAEQRNEASALRHKLMQERDDLRKQLANCQGELERDRESLRIARAESEDYFRGLTEIHKAFGEEYYSWQRAYQLVMDTIQELADCRAQEKNASQRADTEMAYTQQLESDLERVKAQVVQVMNERDQSRAREEMLREELERCVEWLEHRPEMDEGDAATSSRARAILSESAPKPTVTPHHCLICEHVRMQSGGKRADVLCAYPSLPEPRNTHWRCLAPKSGGNWVPPWCPMKEERADA